MAAGNGPRLSPQRVSKLFDDTEKMFRLLEKLDAVNSDIINHLTDMCLQPVEGDAPEVETPRADEVPVPVPEVRSVEVVRPAAHGRGVPEVRPVEVARPAGRGHGI